jgi:hypothetical protein
MWLVLLRIGCADHLAAGMNLLNTGLSSISTLSTKRLLDIKPFLFSALATGLDSVLNINPADLRVEISKTTAHSPHFYCVAHGKYRVISSPTYGHT